MAHTEFYLYKVSVDKPERGDRLQPINHGGAPFDLDKLLSAMFRLHLCEAHAATADDGILLQFKSKISGTLDRCESYALSYQELELLLRKSSKGDFDSGDLSEDAFCAAIIAFAAGGCS